MDFTEALHDYRCFWQLNAHAVPHYLPTELPTDRPTLPTYLTYLVKHFGCDGLAHILRTAISSPVLSALAGMPSVFVC